MANHPASFYLSEEDKDILTHCAHASGLSQSEVVRRLVRLYASGHVPAGVTQIPEHPAAARWAKENLP